LYLLNHIELGRLYVLLIFDVITELEKQIKHSLRQHELKDEIEDGMVMSICVINTKNNKMQYAGAYNSLFLIRDVNNEPELEVIKADRMSVGIFFGREESFTNNEIKLKMGDAFYMPSDGYTDQSGGKDGEKFMTKNLKTLLPDIQNHSMPEQKDILKQKLTDWMVDEEQVDDILVIGVRI
jgi:serine phosphatase RsbU (regulator of sigma subunit)